MIRLDETRDFAVDPVALEECCRKLYSICDSAEWDRRGHAHQAEMPALNRGREAVIKCGDFGLTPAPRTTATFAQ